MPSTGTPSSKTLLSACARENDSHRRIAANFCQASVEGQDDGEDFLFADAARDELRILGAEVEDYYGLGFHG